MLTEGYTGNRRFDDDFRDEFRDWCENRAHGEFEGGSTDMKCHIEGSVVGVKRRSVIPFDTYAYVQNHEGDVSVTGVTEYETDGTKLTFEGSRETIHIGPQAQVRMDFDGVPSQHELSEIRDRERPNGLISRS